MVLPCDWQTTTQRVAQRGQYLLETGKWSDCKFLVGQEPHQQTLEGHKVFLAMSSPVFEAMFYGTMAEKSDPIPIRDVQPEAFKALMEYIYTDRVDLGSFELACELCYCAKKYMLPFLVEECTKFLWSDLSLKKACRAYEFAKLFEEPILMEKCLQMICTKTNEILGESSWEEVEQGTISTILDQDRLEISSEIELFNALERWAEAECSRKSLDKSDPKALRSVIGNTLTKIRFLTLSPQEFAEGPGKSLLLSEQEAFSILMNISSSKSLVQMPETFSINLNPRSASAQETGQTNKFNPVMVEPPQSPLLFSFRRSFSTTRSPNVLENSFLSHDSNSFTLNRETATGREINQEISREASNEAFIAEIRGRPRLYCRRSIIQQSNCRNFDVMDCSVTFTVDRNIFILGVQVPSQILQTGESNNLQIPVVQNLPAERTYTEVLYAHLLDSDGTRLTYTHYTTRATLRDLVEISFNRPINVQKNKIYKIGVVFNKPGWYPIGNCIQRVICENVLFSFNVGTNGVDYMTDGLIKSIIFTHA